LATIVLNPDVMLDSGVAVNYQALAIGNTYKVRNNGKTILYFKKTGANACTVTFTTNGTLKGKALAAVTNNVPATTGDVHTGPFDPTVYDDINHDISFTVSEATGLTVAVLQLPA
jgi:hypothetical protein